MGIKWVFCAGFACLVVAGAATEDSETDPTYCDRDLGYHFYCERAEVPSEITPEPVITEVLELSPSERLAEERAIFENAKAAMVLDPTPENVETYMRLQKRWVDNSAFMTSQWKRVVWANPDLDPSVEWPTSQLGRQTEQEIERAAEKASIDAVKDRYGIFYFGAGDCDFCAVYEQILAGFADRHGVTILPVSTDGKPLKGFEAYQVDTGQRVSMGIADVTPALALFDSETGDVIPVGYGMLTISELEYRIRALTTLETGEEYGVSKNVMD
ncbi:MAG: conjugal transfer protein TraF [Pseudomonadota bacterium]